MKIDMSKLELLVSENDINSKITALANKLDMDYRGKEITLIMILKGSFIFAADLIREMKSPVTIDVIECSSYGQRGTKRGELTINGLDKLDIKGKNVIVLDDIFDSGATMNCVMDRISEKEPNILRGLTLLLKDTKRRLKDANLPDYYLFEIEDKFVIGYGLDYKELYRNLRGIYALRD